MTQGQGMPCPCAVEGNMRRLLLLLLAAISIGFAAAACSPAASNNQAPEPKGPSASWDDQSDPDWRYRSQFKASMRHMWIYANRIVSAGRGDKRPTYDEIWPAAADIQRRARMAASFWNAVSKATDSLQMAMDDDDRPGANEEFRAVGAACDGCHMATWSPYYLHVTPSTVEAWKNNRTKLGMEMEHDDNPPPEFPNRVLMQGLWKNYQAAQLALQDWKKPQVAAELKQMADVSRNQAQLWGQVADNAEKLVELARAQKRAGMPEAYTAMTNACRACHAAWAGPERPIHNPMPWDGPLD